jgi:hypothetical protein
MADDPKADEVTWLDEQFGLRVDVIEGGVDPDGRATAKAMQLTLVHRDSLDTLRIPAALRAGACLELAQLLMAAATVLDPHRASLTVARAKAENRLIEAILEEPTSGVH